MVASQKKLPGDLSLVTSTPYISLGFFVNPGSVGCCILSGEGRIVSVSSYFAQQLDCPVSDIVGEKIAAVFGASHKKVTSELLTEGKTTRIEQNGQPLYWNVHKIVQGSALAGYYVGTLSSGKQVGEFERQLVHHNRLAILGQSAAEMAHELVGSMNAIANNAELLLSQRLDSEAEQCLTMISDDAHRVAVLLQKLLNIGANQPLKIGPQDIVKIVQESIRLLKYQLLNKNVSCRIDSPSTLSPVAGAFEQLIQLFFNILKNASDASLPADEILIQIKESRLRNGRLAIEVAVTDSGEGISPSNLERVFDPFFSTKPVGSGTGLGLSIACQIVAAHQGELELKNSSRKGATATVLLPVFP